MNDYREVRIDIEPCSETGTDLLAALLADAGFESFVPDESGLTAYIKETDYNATAVNDALSEYPFAARLDVRTERIEGRDWNSEWEKNYFQPIVVAGECVVHSSFHTDIPAAKYDIVIDPKMAFGTGHHATTSQVISALLGMELNDKTIVDMGTGTAILAILCAMRGARLTTGIEIDEFAYNNALENVALNGVDASVKLLHGDASLLADVAPADVFIANINRNIITADLPAYDGALKTGGTMILSGFYTEDIPVIMQVAAPLGLTETKHTEQDRWACLILTKA